MEQLNRFFCITFQDEYLLLSIEGREPYSWSRATNEVCLAFLNEFSIVDK